MLKQMTKRLFGLKKTDDEELIIVDGEIINTPKHTNTETYKHKNVQTQKQGQEAETNSLSPETTTAEHESSEHNQSPLEQVNEKPTTLPCSVIPEQYFIFLGSSGRAQRTIQEYTWELNWWDKQHSPVTTLTLADIEGIINNMHPSTARRKIAALRSYAKWRLRDGDDKLFVTLSQIESPRTPIRVPKDKGGDKFKELTSQAVEMTQKGDRRGIWIGLMLCCGLRISEIQTAKSAPGGTIKVLGKGNKERLIPAPEWLRTAIRKEYKNGGQWRKGRKLIWQEMKNMGIKKPHSLRHTYASELVRQGFELEQVKLLLGHAKLDTTLIYAKIKLPENLTERLGIES